MSKQKEFNLSLSGGAALGFAHVGVLEYLYELNLSPHTIYGVSMGSIVGAVEALDLSNSKKIELLDESFSSLSWIRPKLMGHLISTGKIETLLKDIFGKLTFKDLDKELHIGVTNYHTSELEIFNKNNNCNLVDAILASMAVPAVFPARIIDNVAYVDGYLSSNILVDKSRSNRVNLVVNVTGKKAFKSLTIEEIENLSILNNLERSIRELIYNQTKNILKDVDNLILIEPNVSEYKTSSFTKYNEIKAIGKKEAINNLNINKLLI